MFKICFHDWYIFKALTDEEIRVRSSFSVKSRAGLLYTEKICLKCKKYINEIEKRHNYWVSKINKNKGRNKKRRERAELLRSEIKGG